MPNDATQSATAAVQATYDAARQSATDAIQPPAKPTLADKLAAMAADKAKNKPKAALELEYDPSRPDTLVFTIETKDFLNAVGPSSTGTSNGCTLTAEGRFPFSIGGQSYQFALSLKGGWVTVKAIS